MAVKVRPMAESDIQSVSEIFSEGYRFIAKPDSFTDEQLRRLLEERCLPEHISLVLNRYDCSVAEVDGSVAGVIALCGYSTEELWVRPEYHRQGIGTALFRHMEESLRKAGYPKLTVRTTGYGIPFYEAMGMKAVGHKKVTFGPLVGRDLVVLEKCMEK